MQPCVLIFNTASASASSCKILKFNANDNPALPDALRAGYHLDAPGGYCTPKPHIRLTRLVLISSVSSRQHEYGTPHLRHSVEGENCTWIWTSPFHTWVVCRVSRAIEILILAPLFIAVRANSTAFKVVLQMQKDIVQNC